MTALISVNATDSAFTSDRFIIHFGAYGYTHLLVWADHLQDALDEAIDYIADEGNGLTGLLCNEEYEEAYAEAIADGKTQEEAWEAADIDTTSGGNCGDRIRSDEWSCEENPDRARILELQGRA